MEINIVVSNIIRLIPTKGGYFKRIQTGKAGRWFRDYKYQMDLSLTWLFITIQIKND